MIPSFTEGEKRSLKINFPSVQGNRTDKYSLKTGDHLYFELPLYSAHLTQVSEFLTDAPQLGGKDNA